MVTASISRKTTASTTVSKGPKNTTLNHPAAFEAFYEKYAPAFYGEIKRALYKDEVAMHILQVAFLKLYSSVDQYDASKENLFLWAYKIVRKEIGRQKVEMALDKILYTHRLNMRPVQL